MYVFHITATSGKKIRGRVTLSSLQVQPPYFCFTSHKDISVFASSLHVLEISNVPSSSISRQLQNVTAELVVCVEIHWKHLLKVLRVKTYPFNILLVKFSEHKIQQNITLSLRAFLWLCRRKDERFLWSCKKVSEKERRWDSCHSSGSDCCSSLQRYGTRPLQ